jgi:hypothetical protein
MAVDAIQGLGIGNKLVQHCLAGCQRKAIAKADFISNRRLLTRFTPIQNRSFIEVPLETLIMSARYKMELLRVVVTFDFYTQKLF